MAADRTSPDLDLPLDLDAPVAGPSPIQVVIRRWPLLAVGLVAGVVIGVLIHLTSTPIYQSNAQVLVVKKVQPGFSGPDTSTRVVEDYVATQLTLIKSEKIRRASARDLKQAKLDIPMPEDEFASAEIIKGGLAVARDKDTSSANQIGSGIVNLSYKSRDPQDAKRILEAVIHAYKLELGGVFDQATRERIEAINSAIKAQEARQKEANERKIAKQAELRRITTEDVASVRARVSSQKTELARIKLELIGFNAEAAEIEKVGKDRRDRLALYYLLTGQNKPGVSGTILDPNSLDTQLRLLENEQAKVSRALGRDHERMIALREQIALVKKEIERQNPTNPDGVVDELAAYEANLKKRKNTASMQRTELERQLAEDESKLVQAGTIQDDLDGLTASIQSAGREIDRLAQDRTSIEATRDAGGYAANEITPPGDGGQVAPVLIQSLLMGVAIGLVLGGLGVLVAELSDKSFKSPAEIRKRLGLPVIGHIPQIRVDTPSETSAPGGLDPVLAVALRPKSAEAEAYRGLRTQLYFSTQGRGHQVIQVTSPNPGDGKSTLAANLAASIAQSGKRAVLIDCDFRKPRVHKIFDLPSTGEVGLAGVIAGEAPIQAAVRPSGLPNLDLLPCGPRPANPAELLTSPQFQEALDELRRAYDFVIVDTPPLLAVSDPAVVAPRVDGVILTFRMTKKVRPAAERAREQLAALGANVLGVVVNGWASGGRGYYDYNYGSSYGYRYADYEYADEYAEDPSYHGGEQTPLPAKG